MEENFENGKFTGWTNGKVENGGRNFSKFLGRFDVKDRRSNKFPFKTYSGFNPKADSITLEIDFYEIDSWDARTKYGPDLLWIRIDGVKLAIGPFHSSVEENNKSGSAGGIKWSQKSLGKPAHLGFNSNYLDQKHRFTIIIPKQYYSDRKITVKLGAEITGEKHEESAGWDNIKFYEMYTCGRRSLRGVDQMDVEETDDFVDTDDDGMIMQGFWANLF